VAEEWTCCKLAITERVKLDYDDTPLDSCTFAWLFPDGQLAFLAHFLIRHDGQLASFLDPKIAFLNGQYVHYPRTSARKPRRGRSRLTPNN
jgi:hypothetical protein